MKSLANPQGDFEQALVEAFVRALDAVLQANPVTEKQFHVPFEALDGCHRMDAVLRQKDGTILAVECKTNPYPRDIKAALWGLDEYARSLAQSEHDVIRVVAAKRLNPAAREALRSRGVAFYDESGTLFFRHGPVVIDIDRASAPEPRAQAGSPFTGAREQVVHALLNMKDRQFTGKELADAARTSPFTVSQTLQALEQMGWVEGQAAGRNAYRHLAAPAALLDAWAESWSARNESASHWFFFASKPNTLAQTLGARLLDAGKQDWAYTGTCAGNMLAPLLTAVERTEIVVPVNRATDLASAANLSRADQGWNVTLIERSGASDLFRQSAPEYGVPLASPFIIYLDLMKDDRGRNKELAQELRERVLKI